MKSINRYILLQVAGATVFATVCMTIAVWLTQSLRLVELIVNRGLPLHTFGYLVLLWLPTFLAWILPFGLFIAVMFIYYRLMTDSELVVMRTAGLSHASLGWPALFLALLLTGLNYVLYLYMVPTSFRQFKDLQFTIRNDYSAVLLEEGVFNTPAKGLTVYLRSRHPNGEMLGILVHDNRDPERPITMMAERGALVSGEEGPRVVMFNGNRQLVQPETGNLSLIYFDRATIDIGKIREPLEQRWREPRERYLPELLWPDDSPGDQYYAKSLIAAGHQSLVAPFYVLAFAFIGLASLLGGEFNRRGQTRRVLIAIAFVILVQVAGLGLHQLASKVPAVIPLMYANAILPCLIAMFVLGRRPRRPRLSGRGVHPDLLPDGV